MINWDKPIQQRNGTKLVELICTDLSGTYPILTVVTHNVLGKDYKYYWTTDKEGKHSTTYDPDEEHPDDIINVPERQEWFINCYPLSKPAPHGTRAKADNYVADNRIGPARKLIIEGEKIWIEEV